ncbi:helix-turn-helix domain-containing protein [Saccharopolyspora hattusasensis]|uniref:helix-turn-helix domain-containing protein n=1 Tax=Saccharopolyspora hattusasensis TaxID=1128679 RepID=UPI003D955E0E
MQDTPRARALAKELRAVRNAAGATMRQAGDVLGWSEAKVSRFETARRGLTLENVRLFLDALSVAGKTRDRLLKMARELDQPVWWEFGGGVPVQLTELADAESRAVHITSVADVRIPGLLQTRDHSRALLSAFGVEPSDRIEQLIAIRQVRQGILTKPDPVEYEAILDEAVLGRAVGSGRLMAEQLHQIVKMAARDNIAIQVIPFSAGEHTGLDGGFHLLEFLSSSPVVHLEQRRSGAFLDDPDDVAPFVQARSTLRQTALEPDDSLELISTYAKRHEREG